MNQENKELAACPMCGGEAHITKGYATEQVWPHGDFHRVFCSGCQLRQLFYRTPEEAIEAWNRRAAAPTQPAEPEQGVVLTDDQIIEMHDSMFPRVPFERDKIMGNVVRFARAILARQTAPTARPAHETIVRDGDELVCTTCGTTAPTVDSAPQGEPRPLYDALGGLLNALAFYEIASCTQFDQKPKAAKALEEAKAQAMLALSGAPQQPAADQAAGDSGLAKLAAYPLEDFALEGKPDSYKLFTANEWTLTVGDVRNARAERAGVPEGLEDTNDNAALVASKPVAEVVTDFVGLGIASNTVRWLRAAPPAGTLLFVAAPFPAPVAQADDLTTADCPVCKGKGGHEESQCGEGCCMVGVMCDECSGQGKIIVSRRDLAELEGWKTLAGGDKPDMKRKIDVVLTNGVYEFGRGYHGIDWTQVRDWRYSPDEQTGAQVRGDDE